MIGRTLILIIFSLLFFSCAENSGNKTTEDSLNAGEKQSFFNDESQQDFLKHLAEFCGKSFAGEEYFRSLHANSWSAKKLSIRFKTCKPNEVKIEFIVDDNPPITWILAEDQGQLRLMHEHLDAAGELQPGSMYGGLSTDQGTAFVQYFPADEYTGKIMEGAAENTWIVSLPKDMSWLSYRLDRGKERRFEYRFDLTKELN